MQLKPRKYDSCGISTVHLKFASSVILSASLCFLTSRAVGDGAAGAALAAPVFRCCPLVRMRV